MSSSIDFFSLSANCWRLLSSNWTLWDSLKFENGKSDLFKYINEGDFVYFVHSYYGADCDDSVIATSEYGIDVTAAVQKDNIYGCQFHPEKSGDVGLKILKAFCEMED